MNLAHIAALILEIQELNDACRRADEVEQVAHDAQVVVRKALWNAREDLSRAIEVLIGEPT